ncbi:MAG: endonuclease III [Kiritimatiellae bacterium]|nr:endonuclease III [Kiritimatiellia bacterium]MDW8458121.1 endonuclease III [Verrucomicrobiota bacterium]
MTRSETLEQKKRRAREILDRLRRSIPELRCELDFNTPLELAVAAILAAQCTDKRVNQVTPSLFRRYRNASDYANADLRELEELIRSTGFFRNKAKNIKALGAALVERHGGNVPSEMDALLRLPGIGRKTAHLLRANAFGLPGLIIDTHQIRVNQRLGLTSHRDPEKIEYDLQKLLPENDWTDWSHAITLHGRYVCTARAPKCNECPLTDLCPYVQSMSGRRGRENGSGQRRSSRSRARERSAS